jgi:hypothetical protein
LGTNKTPYLRRNHSEKIHIQKSMKKKQAWFLLNPFYNVRCVYFGGIWILFVIIGCGGIWILFEIYSALVQ